MHEEAAFFKVLSDPTRLRLAVLLAVQGETCVCQLAQALEVPLYQVSRHLAIMRAAGTVAARREGTWIHYRLAQPRHHLERCLQDCFRDCLATHATVKADRKRLARATCAKPGRAKNHDRKAQPPRPRKGTRQ